MNFVPEAPEESTVEFEAAHVDAMALDQMLNAGLSHISVEAEIVIEAGLVSTTLQFALRESAFTKHFSRRLGLLEHRIFTGHVSRNLGTHAWRYELEGPLIAIQYVMAESHPQIIGQAVVHD